MSIPSTGTPGGGGPGRASAPLPFPGEFGDLLDFERLVIRHRAEDEAPLLQAVLQDPHLAVLDGAVQFGRAVEQARAGTFDTEAFLARGREAILDYVARDAARLATVFTRDSNVPMLLEQKLVSVACALAACPLPLRPSRPPRPSHRVKRLFGRAACVLALVPVRGATRLMPAGAGRPTCRYAWRLATAADRRSPAAGTARIEVGRAVFVDDVDVDPRTGEVRPSGTRRRPGCIRTEIVVKGIGSTPYAYNRFSKRTSGGLTVLQGQRDWTHSEALARGGVPVYRPLELTLLPYCAWHPSMGWWPLVAYARLPLESLRVSDLERLSPTRAGEAIAGVRAKLAVLSGVPARSIRDADLVRFFVARVGRIAGLCESGRTFGRRPFFHGFLHTQNVSLLGELVDLGEGRFVDGGPALRAAYAASGYADPSRAWSAAIRRARREAVAYLEIVRRLARLVMRAATGGPRRAPPRLDVLFWRCYREGRAGRRADDAREVLDASGWSREGRNGAARRAGTAVSRGPRRRAA